MRDISDQIDELGIQRTHQSEDSMDVIKCVCIHTSKANVKLLFREIRRICRLNISADTDYAWLDWDVGKYGGVEDRVTFEMNILAYRAGKPY